MEIAAAKTLALMVEDVDVGVDGIVHGPRYQSATLVLMRVSRDQ
jgi:hypothetical protein